MAGRERGGGVANGTDDIGERIVALFLGTIVAVFGLTILCVAIFPNEPSPEPVPVTKTIADKTMDMRWASLWWKLIAEDGSHVDVDRATFKQVDEGEQYSSTRWRGP